MGLVAKRITAGQREFDASERELCELAGISSRDTVRRALRALETRGLVSHRDPEGTDVALRLRRSRTWTLLDPPDLAHSVETDTSLLDALDAVAHDVFRNGVGLGKTSARIYCAVLAVPGCTTAELATMTQISNQRLAVLVDELRGFGLVYRDDEGRMVVDGTLLDVAAKELGAEGRLDRQVGLFQRERAARDLTTRI